jgi:MFS family permease
MGTTTTVDHGTTATVDRGTTGTRSLRGTGFGRLWASTAHSNLADGILLAGLPVLATTVTESPAEVAGVTVAVMLPMAVSALPAGVVADRFDRRRVLVTGNVVRALGLGLLVAGIALGELHLAVIYAAAALTGGSEMLVDTTAQTTVPGLVGPDRLEGANARLVGTQAVLNDAVGAPVGSVLATLGAGLLLGAPALLYVAAALLVLRLRVRTRPAAARGGGSALRSAREDVRQGARFVLDHLVLRRLMVVAATSNLGNTAFVSVFVLVVIGPLGMPRASYGLFLAALAVGALLGSVVAERVLRSLGQARALRVAFAGAIGAYAAVAVTSAPWVVGLATAALGGVVMVTNVGSRSLRQTVAPDAILGRVTATMACVSLVATPVGGVLAGAVAEAAGVRAGVWLAVAANVVALVLLRPVTAEAIATARVA